MKHDPRGLPPYAHPDEIAADLAQERAALAQTMADLRARLNPSAVLAEGASLLRRQGENAQSFLPKGAAPWVAGAAIAGIGLAYLALRSNSEPEDVPQWLADVREARARADELLVQIDQAQAEGLLPAAELEQAAKDVERALELDTRRALLSGLEGLARDERDAALAVREARLANRRKGVMARHPLLTGVLGAGLAASAAALYKSWDQEGTEGLLAEAKAALDAAIEKIDTLRG